MSQIELSEDERLLVDSTIKREDYNDYHNYCVEINGVARAVLLLKKHGLTIKCPEDSNL